NEAAVLSIGADNVVVEVVDQGGRCLSNVTRQVTVVVGDRFGAPLAGTEVTFIVEPGRGLITRNATSDAGGQASATFRSLCPQDVSDEIRIVALARGREQFTDLNANGRYDSGEPFVDLPMEVFLDA